VRTILDLHDPNTKIYEAHYGMTQDWAAALLGLGYDPNMPLSYDRETGAVTLTLGQLAAQTADSSAETFHFVLNNSVLKDNRIPPYGFSYDEARKRNALPVPASQYGGQGEGSTYNYWDDFTLTPPGGAVHAEINLMYQPTSWEYIQFLWLANNGQNAFLANEGINLLDAWLKTGMASYYVMASTTWGAAPTPPTPTMVVSSLTTWSVGRGGTFSSEVSTFKSGDTVGIRSVVADESSLPLSGAQVFMEITDQGGTTTIASIQGFTDDNGTADLTWKTSRKQTAGSYTAVVTGIIKNGYDYNSGNSVTSVDFVIQ
jgi:hypothetical protein